MYYQMAQQKTTAPSFFWILEENFSPSYLNEDNLVQPSGIKPSRQ
jgi:hypothetical protein